MTVFSFLAKLCFFHVYQSKLKTIGKTESRFYWGLGTCNIQTINAVNIGPDPFRFFPVFSKKRYAKQDQPIYRRSLTTSNKFTWNRYQYPLGFDTEGVFKASTVPPMELHSSSNVSIFLTSIFFTRFSSRTSVQIVDAKSSLATSRMRIKLECRQFILWKVSIKESDTPQNLSQPMRKKIYTIFFLGKFFFRIYA